MEVGLGGVGFAGTSHGSDAFTLFDFLPDGDTNGSQMGVAGLFASRMVNHDQVAIFAPLGGKGDGSIPRSEDGGIGGNG